MRDTESYYVRSMVVDHRQRIVKLETLVERMDNDMKEQTQILGEVRDGVVGLKSVVKALMALVGLVGVVVSVVMAIVR